MKLYYHPFYRKTIKKYRFRIFLCYWFDIKFDLKKAANNSRTVIVLNYVNLMREDVKEKEKRLLFNR